MYPRGLWTVFWKQYSKTCQHPGIGWQALVMEIMLSLTTTETLLSLSHTNISTSWAHISDTGPQCWKTHYYKGYHHNLPLCSCSVSLGRLYRWGFWHVRTLEQQAPASTTFYLEKEGLLPQKFPHIESLSQACSEVKQVTATHYSPDKWKGLLWTE